MEALKNIGSDAIIHEVELHAGLIVEHGAEDLGDAASEAARFRAAYPDDWIAEAPIPFVTAAIRRLVTRAELYQAAGHDSAPLFKDALRANRIREARLA